MTECEVCGQAASADAPLPCVNARRDGTVLQGPPGDCPHQDWHAEYVEAWERARSEEVAEVAEDAGHAPPVIAPGTVVEPPGFSPYETRLALCLEAVELLVEREAYRTGQHVDTEPAEIALRLAEIAGRLRMLREHP